MPSAAPAPGARPRCDVAAHASRTMASVARAASASRAWTAGSAESGAPNCTRARACSTASSSERCASPATYASVAAFQARQQATAATGSSSPVAATSTCTVPLPSSVISGRPSGGRRAEAEAASPRRNGERGGVATVPRPPVDPERRSEGGLVDEADRRGGAPELDPPATTAPSSSSPAQSSAQPAAAARAASSSSRSSCQVPSSGSRGGRQSPTAARIDVREERQLVRDLEPHASSPRTASVSAPSAGAAAGARAARRRRGRTARGGRSLRGRAARRARRAARRSPAGRRGSSRAAGPGRTARRPPRVPRATRDGLLRERARDRRRQLLLRREHGRVVGDEVGCVDRRVIECRRVRGTRAAARG